MYVLDTNIVSYWMRGDISVIGRIRSHSPADLSMAAITLAEILYGIEKSADRKRERLGKIDRITSLLQVHPFDEEAAEQYAIVRAALEVEGNAMSERDTQIAAVALTHESTVVTHNTREFRRVAGLQVEDWAKA
jgi:tRNA(fMet)-specific endonuclease VapC